MRTNRRILMLGGMSVVALALNGCVTSERSAYQRQLDHSMAHEPAAHEDVAFAFGLDDYAPNRASATALRGDSPDNEPRH